MRNKRILDIGSGYGGFGQYVRSFGLNCKVVDLDISCSSSPDALGVRGSAYLLPFKDNTFDIVVSSGCIPILCVGSKLTGETQAKLNTKKALKEAFRVTKPRGQIRMHRVPTVNDINYRGLYEWEYWGFIAVAHAVEEHVLLLNSKGNKASVENSTLIIYKKV